MRGLRSSMDKIIVEVCYAESSMNIFFISLMTTHNSTIKEVLYNCGVFIEYPHLDISDIVVGINSKNTGLDAKVTQYDRIVIYRPLKILPHEARKLRAEKNKIK